jgi:hypothetical protein
MQAFELHGSKLSLAGVTGGDGGVLDGEAGTISPRNQTLEHAYETPHR